MNHERSRRPLLATTAILLLSAPTLARDCPATDGLEPNDDCATATLLTPGTYTGLVVQEAPSADYYEIAVPAGQLLHVDANYANDDGELLAFVWRSTLPGICGNELEWSSHAALDFSGLTIDYLNDSDDTQHVALVIEMAASTGNGTCKEYDLAISLDPPPAPTPLCFGDGSSGPCPCDNESALGAGEGCASSVGVGAVLFAAGTAGVVADDLTLLVAQARPQQPGMLIQGAPGLQLPFKDGILCAGLPTERIEVIFTDANGAGSSTTSIVTAGAVLPGQTRIYQHWFRDPGLSPCGSGSNFSSALRIDWE